MPSCKSLIHLLPSCLLLGACIENGLNTGKDGTVGFDTGSPPTGIDTGTTTVTAEVCDGIDNDADGEVDEGFGDADADGYADCVDLECPALVVGEAGEVATLDECRGSTSGTPTVDDAWNAVVRWEYAGVSTDPTAHWICAAPVVGNLDDDDGNGVVDEHDVPDIVVNVSTDDYTYDHGYLVALDGATGAEKWIWQGVTQCGGLALADVDGDGVSDVIASAVDPLGYGFAYAVAIDANGVEKWRNDEPVSWGSLPVPTVADLDEDGSPEVIFDFVVMDGATGTTLFTVGSLLEAHYGMAGVADADLDGFQEVYFLGRAWSSSGTLLWDVGDTRLNGYGTWPVIVQADADPEAEIGFVGGSLTLSEWDGTRRFTEAYGTETQPGPPCAGDFDGDGVTEVAFASYQALYLYELDGTLVWSKRVSDLSGVAGCSGFDVDGDGALEVLYADEGTFYIVDGRTGDTRFDATHVSGTATEYPVAADVDGDGHAEIVVAESFGDLTVPALRVYGHAGEGWPAAGPAWGLHDFAVTNLEPDGSVPAAPLPYWSTFGVYRARPATDDLDNPDLVVSFTDVCVADCFDGPVGVAVQVSNVGLADVAAGTPLALYALEGTPRLVATTSLEAIPAGTRAEGITLSLSPADVGVYGLRVVVDDDGAGGSRVHECDETNNVDDYADVSCP
jgi:hypothetical protein